jgi:hypothetical protein
MFEWSGSVLSRLRSRSRDFVRVDLPPISYGEIYRDSTVAFSAAKTVPARSASTESVPLAPGDGCRRCLS